MRRSRKPPTPSSSPPPSQIGTPASLPAFPVSSTMLSSPPPRDEEPIVALPGPRHAIERTTRFRSTWIVTSQNALRARGLGARYGAMLAVEHREALELATVGRWVPIEVAAAHYQACDDLGLSPADQIALGREAANRLDQALLGTAAARSRAEVKTMWTPLAQFQRLWERMFVGGAAAVHKLGPREARIEFVGCTLVTIPYFRAGLRGVILGIADAFTQKVYVTELGKSTVDAASFRCSWI